MAAGTVEPGERLGSWTVEAILGEGGMAVVARARSDRGAVAALKILTRMRRADSPGLLDRLKREADVLDALADIPSVVRRLDLFHDEEHDAHVLVLEHIEGRPLGSLLGDPSLDVRQVVEWMGHACHALHDIHARGFVHRDLKPDNLLLVADPDCPLRIIDFNSAGSSGPEKGRLTRVQGVFPHTPAYLAPECFDGVQPDKSSDVYAICMTFAELLIGRHPLLDEGVHDLDTRTEWRRTHDERAMPDLPSLRPDIPEALHEVLARGTAKLRRERLMDAVELWKELEPVWRGLERPETDPPSRAGDPEAGEPDLGAARRQGLVLGLVLGGVLLAVALVLLAGVAVGVGVPWMAVREREAEAEARADELRQQQAQVAAEEAQRDEARREEAEREAEEAQRRQEEAQRRQEEAARREREQKKVAEERARALGVAATPPEVVDAVVLDKLRHASRFGSHWIYESHGFGTATLEEVGDVLFFEGRNTGPGQEARLQGVVTRVDDRGVELQGRYDIRYVGYDGERDPPCGRSGRLRLNLAGHPWYFRMQGDCAGRHHYVDLFVDDAWLDANPSHKHPY